MIPCCLHGTYYVSFIIVGGIGMYKFLLELTAGWNIYCGIVGEIYELFPLRKMKSKTSLVYVDGKFTQVPD